MPSSLEGKPPLAIWPCAQHPTPSAETVNEELARRLLIELTPAHGLVLDPYCGLTSLVQAARLERHALGLVPEAHELARLHTHLVTHLSPEQQTRVQVWQEQARHADELLADVGGQVDLVVWDPPHADPHQSSDPQTVGDALAACARLLAPRGCVAVVARRHQDEPGTAAHLVETAQAAGLDYLQHIIALTVPIRASRLPAPPQAPTVPLTPHTADAAMTLHHPAHTDVLLFRPQTPPSTLLSPEGSEEERTACTRENVEKGVR